MREIGIAKVCRLLRPLLSISLSISLHQNRLQSEEKQGAS